MTYERLVGRGLDYSTCQYGMSKLSFRGPKIDTTGDYVAFIGSTETYGKFVEAPFAAQAAEKLGLPAVNLGCVNAGIDAFYSDPSVIGLCRDARVTVVQAMGAHKQSNRLYRVHPRRNDRFLAASEGLRAMFPKTDFAEVHFTRHLMAALARESAARFAEVCEELRAAWTCRMVSLVREIGGPVVLLWLSERAPEDGAQDPAAAEPLFVGREMIEALRPHVAEVVEMAPRMRGAGPAPGMICPEIEAPAAIELPGPEDHARAAEALVPVLRPYL